MTFWQEGYADAYCHPKFRPYPTYPHNEDYMDGYTFGQSEYRKHQKKEEQTNA